MTLNYHTARAAIFLAAAVAGTATVAFATSAAAQELPVTIYGQAADARTELVSFAKLDLANARDRKRLERRVGAAVERVCMRDIGRAGLQDRGCYQCEAGSRADASSQIARAVSRTGAFAFGGGSSGVTAIRIRAR